MVHRVPVLTEWARYPSIARDSGCLVYESRRETQNIMLLPLVYDGAPAAAAESLIVSNGVDCDPTWSPDGQQIAFISTRSGHRELWTCAQDGSAPRQLTRFAGGHVASPVWSPGSRQMAFVVIGEKTALYVIETGGGRLRRIRAVDQNLLPCSWSRDGEWIYCASDVGGSWDIWRVGFDSSGASRVTNDGGMAAIEAPAGERLYYVQPDRPGIWSRPVDGGAPACVVADFPASHFRDWTVTETGIFYVRPAGSTAVVVCFDPVSGETCPVARIPSYPAPRFSVAPDGQSMLFARSELLDIDLHVLDYLPSPALRSAP
jgi:dipeptidyl aminopeptidase/acylaminoacyl peptidase